MTEPKPSTPKSSGLPIACKWIVDDAFTLRANARPHSVAGESAEPPVVLAPTAGAGITASNGGARPAAAA